MDICKNNSLTPCGRCVYGIHSSELLSKLLFHELTVLMLGSTDRKFDDGMTVDPRMSIVTCDKTSYWYYKTSPFGTTLDSHINVCTRLYYKWLQHNPMDYNETRILDKRIAILSCVSNMESLVDVIFLLYEHYDMKSRISHL